VENILNDIKNYNSVIDYIRQEDMKNDQNLTALEYYGNKILKKDYWKYINRYRNYLYNLGINQGEAVAICMLNSPEYEFFFSSLLENGSIASTVSKSFLNADLKAQTVKRGIKKLILSVEFLPELIQNKTFDQMYSDENKECLDTIIFTSAGNYQNDADEEKYNSRDFKELISKLNLPENVNIIYPGETVKTIKNTSDIVLPKPYVVNQIATYSNTGGTTGAPKCATHTHKAIISLLMSHRREVYKEFNILNHSRSLLVIPISHITSQFYGLLIRRASNANIIYHPGVFEPQILRQVLIEEQIDDTVLPFGLYYAITRKEFKKGELKLNTATCGGEPTPYIPTIGVNKVLEKAGAEPLVIGTGSTELGSGVMASYGIEGRSNESGYFFPFAKGFLMDPKDGSIITEEGKRGILYSNAPWQMNGYLNDQKSTDEFFNYALDGTIYGTNNDIAEIVGEHKGKPVYSMHGRTSDFVLKNGNTYYPGVSFEDGIVKSVDFESGKFLFDVRDTLQNIPGVMEVQPLIVPIEENNKEGHVVVNVTINPSFNPKDILEVAYKTLRAENNLIPAGIVFRTRFERSLSSDKREVLSLVDEKNGYYYINEKGEILSVSLNKNEVEYGEVEGEIKILEPPAPKLVYSNIKK